MTKGGKIYQDALGNPEPLAAISRFGGSGHPSQLRDGYFSFRAASNAPGRKWVINPPENSSREDQVRWAANKMAEIAREMEEEGWIVKIGKDGYNVPMASLTHQATAEALQSSTEQHGKKWANGKEVYVRYGKLPPGGKSTNYRDNITEKGVSVFRGILLPSGEIMAVPQYNDELGSMMMGLQQRSLYVVEGKEVGIGSDGEPVLSNAKLLTGIQAAKKYFGV